MVEEGLFSLFNGMVSTILREVPCYAAQFSAYYYSKRLWAVYFADGEVDKVSMFG